MRTERERRYAGSATFTSLCVLLSLVAALFVSSLRSEVTRQAPPPPPITLKRCCAESQRQHMKIQLWHVLLGGNNTKLDLFGTLFGIILDGTVITHGEGRVLVSAAAARSMHLSRCNNALGDPCIRGPNLGFMARGPVHYPS